MPKVRWFANQREALGLEAAVYAFMAAPLCDQMPKVRWFANQREALGLEAAVYAFMAVGNKTLFLTLFLTQTLTLSLTLGACHFHGVARTHKQ